jgi:hypothetical protein
VEVREREGGSNHEHMKKSMCSKFVRETRRVRRRPRKSIRWSEIWESDTYMEKRKTPSKA